MIGPRIKDTAKELCEQLVETYMAKNKKIESEITAQIKTKRILLQFILEMWEKGFVIENDKSGRNTVEKEIISYVQQNFKEKISLKEFGEQFHLSEKYISRYFKEHFHITLSSIYYTFTIRVCKTAVTRYGYSCYRDCNAERISECKLFYQKLQKSIWSFSVKV